MSESATFPRHLLGTGVLTWGRMERISNRYGFVYLMPDGHNSLSAAEPRRWSPEPGTMDFAGMRGRLVAKVIESRKSTHIGDLALGIFPVRPDEGERIVLGEGRFSVLAAGPDCSSPRVGLEPFAAKDDGDPWLDVQALYRAHEQLVALYFEPEIAA